MSNFNVVVDKILSEEPWAAVLVSNPEIALREAGVEPTEEMITALNAMDADAVRKMAAVFNGKDLAAS